jgi:hypothetical protein
MKSKIFPAANVTLDKVFAINVVSLLDSIARGVVIAPSLILNVVIEFKFFPVITIWWLLTWTLVTIALLAVVENDFLGILTFILLC